MQLLFDFLLLLLQDLRPNLVCKRTWNIRSKPKLAFRCEPLYFHELSRFRTAISLRHSLREKTQENLNLPERFPSHFSSSQSVIKICHINLGNATVNDVQVPGEAVDVSEFPAHEFFSHIHSQSHWLQLPAPGLRLWPVKLHLKSVMMCSVC